MAKRREFNVFSLSFLDIMSCGFGAVILIYIVINHSTEVTSQTINLELMAEVTRLEQEVTEGTDHLVEIRNSLKVTDDEIVTTEGMANEIVREIQDLESRIAALAKDGASQSDDIEALKKELKKLQEEAATMEGSVAGSEETGTSLRSFVGEGDRQYLTGLNVGGTHILILLDASASMLHRNIANAVILRNLDDADPRKRQAEKWRRAVRTIDWILANLPKDSKFQLLTFNTDTHAIIESKNSWIDSIDKEKTDLLVENLNKVIPAGGTSLHYPFAAVRDMDPRPDNIFLVVDSLPTQDFDPPRRSRIRSSDRAELFSEAMEELPQDIPVNVILFPMEGDPLATPYFWILAQVTGGAFMTPSKDWP